MPNGKELVLETLLKFCHFESAPDSNFRDNLGAPPMGGTIPGLPDLGEEGANNVGEELNGDMEGKRAASGEGAAPTAMPSENGMKKKAPKSLTYSQIRWIGEWVCDSFLV